MLFDVSSSRPMRRREIGLLAEVADGLRDFIVGNFEIVFLEVGDEFVAATENGEKNVDQIDGLRDAGLLLRRIVGRRSRLLRSVRGGGEEKNQRQECWDEGESHGCRL